MRPWLPHYRLDSGFERFVFVDIWNVSICTFEDLDCFVFVEHVYMYMFRGFTLFETILFPTWWAFRGLGRMPQAWTHFQKQTFLKFMKLQTNKIRPNSLKWANRGLGYVPQVRIHFQKLAFPQFKTVQPAQMPPIYKNRPRTHNVTCRFNCLYIFTCRLP